MTTKPQEDENEYELFGEPGRGESHSVTTIPDDSIVIDHMDMFYGS